MTREKLAYSGILQMEGIYAKVLLYIIADDINMSITTSDIINRTGADRHIIHRVLSYLERNKLVVISKGSTLKSPNIISAYPCSGIERNESGLHPIDTPMSYDMVIDIDDDTPVAVPSTVMPSVTPTVVPTVTQTVTQSASNDIDDSELTVMPSVTQTVTPSVTPTVTPTVIVEKTGSVTPTVTQSVPPTVMPSVTQSASNDIDDSELTVMPSVTPTVMPTVTESAISAGYIDDNHRRDTIYLYIYPFLKILEKEEYSNSMIAGMIYDFYKQHLRGSKIRKDAVKKIEDLLTGTHYFDKNKKYTPEQLVHAIGEYHAQVIGKGQGIMYDANKFYGQELIFHLYLPGAEKIENVSGMREVLEERRADADEVLVLYEKHIKPARRRIDARNNIEKLLAGKGVERAYTKDELRSSVLAYGKTRIGEPEKYHYDAANFFGGKAVYYNFLPENQVEPQRAERKKDDGVFHMEI